MDIFLQPINPDTIIPFLEKCKTEAYPKWERNEPPTEKHEKASQFRFGADGLQFVATGFDTALTGDYQLNWGQIEGFCDHLIQKQKVIPRSITYSGVLINNAGQKDVTFLLLSSYEVHNIGAQLRKTDHALLAESQTGSQTIPEHLAVCPSKRRFAKRQTKRDHYIKLEHAPFYVRGKLLVGATQVAYNRLQPVIFQAYEMLTADNVMLNSMSSGLA